MCHRICYYYLYMQMIFRPNLVYYSRNKDILPVSDGLQSHRLDNISYRKLGYDEK